MFIGLQCSTSDRKYRTVTNSGVGGGIDRNLIFRTKTRTKPKTRELNPNGHFQMDKPRLGRGGLSRASLQGHVPSAPFETWKTWLLLGFVFISLTFLVLMYLFFA